MSTEQPQWGYPTQPQPAPRPRRPLYRRPWFIILVAGSVLFLLFMIVGLMTMGAAVSELDRATSPAQKPLPTANSSVVPPDSTEDNGARGTYDKPSVHDFEMKVHETSREHFGSGLGDLVEAKLELVQVRERNYDPDIEYDLKYRIVGDEEGPQTNTITLRGDAYEEPYEDMFSTKARNGKITAEIVSIRKA